MTSTLSRNDRAERDAEIIRLGNRHVRAEKIVKRVPGATYAIVSNVLFHARLAGDVKIGVRGKYRLRPKNSGDRYSFPIPPDVSEMLKPAAIARGMSITELAKHILIAVADGGIVDAVLDDGVKSG